MLLIYLSIFALAGGAVMASGPAAVITTSIPSRCIPTCAVPNPPNCGTIEPGSANQYGCQCKAGYILSEIGGKCIKIEDCPTGAGCNGDPHARVKQCPLPSPSTCDAPDAIPCDKACDPVGCECEPGYMLSEKNGKCILPDECPGGNPCGPNGTFALCQSLGPYDYCPLDDSRSIKICDFYPFPPCYPGCICKQNYKRNNDEEARCILASDCPPVKCTRPNEEWNSCPSCPAEFCPDVDRVPPVCNTTAYICDPGCMCKKNFLRNKEEICIPADECRELNAKTAPQCGINEESYVGKPLCPPDTCESIYTTYMCEDTSNLPDESRCRCISQYLRNSDSVCVPSVQCPPPAQQCGINEESYLGKPLCPPDTCESVYTSYKCENIANQPDKSLCRCISEHLRNSDGICVPSKQCQPPDVSCGPNGTYAGCGFRCPNQYCPQDDSGLVIACRPGPNCPPDCICKDNYKRKSYDDDTCILAKDCPPVNCTRPNEVWNPCSQCLAERCDEVNKPNICDDPLETNCDPKCVCAPGHCKDNNNICVPIKKSPPQCGINEELYVGKPLCSPDTCESIYTTYMCEDTSNLPDESRCRCISEHLRNSDGVCVPSTQCPPAAPQCGINEESYLGKPLCPPDTCESVYTSYMCENIANQPDKSLCRCISEHLRNSDGVCVPSDQCQPPENSSCNGDEHARIKKCPQSSHSTSCTPDATSCKRKCNPVGCECKPGYKFSKKTGKCVLPKDCKGQ